MLDLIDNDHPSKVSIEAALRRWGMIRFSVPFVHAHDFLNGMTGHMRSEFYPVY